jgi:hypothetical protein
MANNCCNRCCDIGSVIFMIVVFAWLVLFVEGVYSRTIQFIAISSACLSMSLPPNDVLTREILRKYDFMPSGSSPSTATTSSLSTTVPLLTVLLLTSILPVLVVLLLPPHFPAPQSPPITAPSSNTIPSTTILQRHVVRDIFSTK